MRPATAVAARQRVFVHQPQHAGAAGFQRFARPRIHREPGMHAILAPYRVPVFGRVRSQVAEDVGARLHALLEFERES